MARSTNRQLAELQSKFHACEESIRILLAAEDAEGARITRLLHDNVGQCVAALQLGFRGLERELDSGADVKLTLQSLHAISQSVGEELHKVALELRPTSLDDYGLVRSLATFLNEWSLLTRTAVDFDHLGLGQDRLPRHLESSLFRIIRDLLHVVAQRAQVTHVSIILRRQLDCIVSVVEHNGGSVDSGTDPESQGSLASARARVALLDGTLQVEDCAVSGRTMIVRLPRKRLE